MARYFSGSIAPDVRYIQPGLGRQTTHDLEVGAVLGGAFGAGYRHHLAVDSAFYGRFEQEGFLRRLGPMNVTILCEIYALRRLPSIAHLPVPPMEDGLRRAGVATDSLRDFISLSDHYVQSRDIDRAIVMLSESVKERATRYLNRWQRLGKYLRAAAWVSSPWIEGLFRSILIDADRQVANAETAR